MSEPDDQTIADLPTLAQISDLRLVVTDMDGTLLGEDGRIPDGFWSLVDRMAALGITFAPASGRQYATLHHLFARIADGMAFIAENGTYVVRDGMEIGSTTLGEPIVEPVVRTLRDTASHGRNVGVVLCGKQSAYVERDDENFLAEARRYYAELAIVDDLLAVEDDMVKIAIWDFDEAAGTEPVVARFRETHQVVVSGHHWIDIMPALANKGVALRQLQAELGIGPHQTAAFGDFLNDLELLDEAEMSFAMANAHPDILERARFTAPANTEAGVVTTLARMLDQLEAAG